MAYNGSGQPWVSLEKATTSLPTRDAHTGCDRRLSFACHHHPHSPVTTVHDDEDILSLRSNHLGAWHLSVGRPFHESELNKITSPMVDHLPSFSEPGERVLGNILIGPNGEAMTKQVRHVPLNPYS